MRYLMRLAASLSFAFLMGSVSLPAQNSSFGSAQMQGLTHVMPNGNSACPVSLLAKHGSDGAMRKVDKNRPEGIAQLLHLILTSKNSRQIVEAQLKVRGASGKGQLSRTEAAQNGMDATRNVVVKLRPNRENEATGDVWIPGMAAVLEVELNWVAFDGGGIQRFAAADGCRFTPDHLMLIAGESN
ncbi:MAG TPA: hypothetical protein VL498_05725 [Terracidiphilus sp.]|jgi:hypothetical protein|nr:hypothetical protein [Terracidiphilus sp.]